MGSSGSRSRSAESRSANSHSTRGISTSANGHHNERGRMGTATLARIRRINHRIYKTARGTSDVNCCVKYCLFTVNFILCVVSVLITVAGVWAFNEKTTSLSVESLANIPFDPAAMLILLGLLSSFVTFCAWFGALRENTGLLMIFVAMIASVLFAQVACAVCVAIYRERIETEVRTGLMRLITLYRDDLDLRDMIDALQYALACCGVLSVDDWDANIYFNCSSPSIEACGVPPSCCIIRSTTAVSDADMDNGDGNPNTPPINLQCGYKTRTRSQGTKGLASMADDRGGAAQTEIQRTGCYTAATQWIVTNQAALVSVAVTLGIIQVLAICLAQSLRAEVLAARRKFKRETREHREIIREQRELQAALEESAQMVPEAQQQQQSSAGSVALPALGGTVILVPASMMPPLVATTSA